MLGKEDIIVKQGKAKSFTEMFWHFYGKNSLKLTVIIFKSERVEGFLLFEVAWQWRLIKTTTV